MLSLCLKWVLRYRHFYHETAEMENPKNIWLWSEQGLRISDMQMVKRGISPMLPPNICCYEKHVVLSVHSCEETNDLRLAYLRLST